MLNTQCTIKKHSLGTRSGHTNVSYNKWCNAAGERSLCIVHWQYTPDTHAKVKNSCSKPNVENPYPGYKKRPYKRGML
eukprot:9489369-Pyramimonas_sp.AAC.1